MKIALVRNQLGTFMGCSVEFDEHRISNLSYPVIVQWIDIPVPGKVGGIVGISTQIVMIAWPSIKIQFFGVDSIEACSVFDSETDKDIPFIKQYLQRVSEVWKVDLSKPIVTV